jgi:oligoribonuclease
MLAWMDLEMTGLDPERHVIVEIATLITNDDLEIVAEGPNLIIHRTGEELSRMDEVVVAMHTRSGLLEAIKTSTVSHDEAFDATLAFIKTHIPEAKSVPLCGNSIGTDRRFLSTHMNEIDEYLHYRSVDVSTIKELAKRWNTSVFKHAPRKAGGHRAMDDIKESLKELQYYRSVFFTADTGN